MIVYIHPKCTTCKKALEFLKSHFKDDHYNLKDITTTPPSRTELEQMLLAYNGDVKKLFNTSGMQYRELALTDRLKTMSENDALELLSQNGMLVKRPFLIGDNIGLVGFNEATWINKLISTGYLKH